jgi:DNA-directed RNA polymerase subunit RPC12/RpoP
VENKNEKIYDHCPHCDRMLSPWEQVLLSVDRALMCKGCWYRIILDAFDQPAPRDNHSSEAEEKSI